MPKACFGAIRRVRERGVSVVFISHRLKEIFQVADRVTVLRDGKRVLTADIGETGMDEMLRAMVGSELKERLEPQASSAATDEEALRVDGPVPFRGAPRGDRGAGGSGRRSGRTELLEWLFGAGGRARRFFVAGGGRSWCGLPPTPFAKAWRWCRTTGS